MSLTEKKFINDSLEYIEIYCSELEDNSNIISDVRIIDRTKGMEISNYQITKWLNTNLPQPTLLEVYNNSSLEKKTNYYKNLEKIEQMKDRVKFYCKLNSVEDIHEDIDYKLKQDFVTKDFEITLWNGKVSGLPQPSISTLMEYDITTIENEFQLQKLLLNVQDGDIIANKILLESLIKEVLIIKGEVNVNEYNIEKYMKKIFEQKIKIIENTGELTTNEKIKYYLNENKILNTLILLFFKRIEALNSNVIPDSVAQNALISTLIPIYDSII